ncbi:MAG: DUF2892 domain-containing protein [Elusimicrobia bacterium]|nr:DUF2892 domain-containing protein [Elusimicrobiota bacterium]
MNRNDVLRLLAGVVTLAGVSLGWFISPWFYLLAAFAAVNQIQSAFTKWCPAMWVLDKLGLR